MSQLLRITLTGNAALRSWTYHSVENCNGTTDSAVSSGDESFLASELASSFVKLIAASGGWELVVHRCLAGHLMLFAWNWILLGDRNLVAWGFISKVRYREDENTYPSQIEISQLRTWCRWWLSNLDRGVVWGWSLRRCKEFWMGS